jgi:hypothetical protein
MLITLALAVNDFILLTGFSEKRHRGRMANLATRIWGIEAQNFRAFLSEYFSSLIFS